MNTVEILLPHGGGKQTPTEVIIHAMAEYIIVDPKTAKRYGIKAGEYHAFRWLDVIKLSAHSLITTNGGNIRTRRDEASAWHAKNHNTGTLGIEFLVPGSHDYAGFLRSMRLDYLPELAYQAGLDQVREWLNIFEISIVTTHAEIDPNRKHDPGTGFPFDRFIHDL